MLGIVITAAETKERRGLGREGRGQLQRHTMVKSRGSEVLCMTNQEMVSLSLL